MAEALAIKNSEIEALVSAADGLKKEAAISEGNMASLQLVSFQSNECTCSKTGFHGKGSGIRTKSSRGLDALAKIRNARTLYNCDYLRGHTNNLLTLLKSIAINL
ncbi:hypothetical protein FNV43_RR00749 [Rhamnella rubrinervis]|uniref:Uncharacterized protein n=1 Tax=Rhamnella rubrinervis TaxID=2594499 RepID=A0A8K0HRA2_9ROSA|nr:hypothetical protein FNV43_RR00749 [Rhamnella rubrinervis]